MYINKINSVKNFRNLEGLNFTFNKEVNFIVGNNNIGKTNVIEMLNSIFNIGKFNMEDFLEVDKKIEVELEVCIYEACTGYFDNIFDVGDSMNKITIVATQEDPESRIEYRHFESDMEIRFNEIRGFNYLYYSSLRSVKGGVNFKNRSGVGNVLNYILDKSLKEVSVNQADLINTDEIEKVLCPLNLYLNKLNSFMGIEIGAYINEDNPLETLNRILEIGQNAKINLMDLGDGIQYSYNIILNILDLLVTLTKRNKEEFDKICIFDNGKKYLSLIIALDEPEVHQHPYRQRTLIKNIHELINNKNDDFLQLLKELFDIDGLIGQIIIVTHSPNIILNDYSQIIRMYEEENVKAISTSELELEEKEHKNLLRSFVYIKETLFARAVIIVEGYTEYGALPYLAKKLNIDFDKENIGIINLEGADSVLSYLKLFDSLGIDAYAILDKDKEETYQDNSNIYFTSGMEFEDDIFNSFNFDDYLKYLVLLNKHSFLIKHLENQEIDFNKIEFMESPLEYEINSSIKRTVMFEIKERETENLKKNKTILNGCLLGEYVSNVPETFENVINLVMEE